MIVDCHTHISCLASDADVSDHLTASEQVDACIVLPAPQGDIEQSNRTVAEYVRKHAEKMVGFALVDPTRDKVGPKNLATMTEKLGLNGVVLYCSSFGFHPTHSKAMRLYESAVEIGLPVFFHNGGALGPDAVLDYAQSFLLDEVARSFPGLKILIGSMGMPFVAQTLSMLAKHTNVYADLTIDPSKVWQVYNLVVSAYEAGVMDKLLFGSGFPFGRAGECMEALLGFNKLLGDIKLPTVPRGSIRSVIERDALELLGINKQVAASSS